MRGFAVKRVTYLEQFAQAGLRIGHLQERAVLVVAQTAKHFFGAGAQIKHVAVLAQTFAVDGAQHRAAACGQDAVVVFAEIVDDALLDVSESLFALAVKKLTNGTTQALLNDAVGGLSTTAVDTATEVEDLIKVSANVMKQAMATPGTNAWSYTTDSEWITALSTLGISGLTGMSATNLTKVKDGITAITAATDIDTWAELQGIVSLVRINDNAANSANSVLNFSDFQAFFTYGDASKTDIANTSVCLNAFRDAVQYKPSNVFSVAEVGSMVNGYAAILAEANGTASDQQVYDPQASDYLAVGVGSGTGFDTEICKMLGDSNGNGLLDAGETSSQFANLLTDVVSTKNQTDVDTVSELNDLAKIVVKIYELEKATSTGNTTYTSITNGILSVSELNALGLNTTVLTDSGTSPLGKTSRMNGFYDAIINAANPSSVDSLAELQAMIANTAVL